MFLEIMDKYAWSLLVCEVHELDSYILESLFNPVQSAEKLSLMWIDF